MIVNCDTKVLCLKFQVNLKGDWLRVIKALIPFPTRGYAGYSLFGGFPLHSLAQPKCCDFMEERMDVGVASSSRARDSMEIQ